MHKVKILLMTFLLGLLCISCHDREQDCGKKHYTDYYKKADALLSSRKCGLAELYVDSIRNHSYSDTTELVGAFADLLQSWIDVYNLDEESSLQYARKAYGVLSRYDEFSSEIAALSSLLAYSYCDTHPDSTVYFSDVCIAQDGNSAERIVEAFLYKAEAYKNMSRYGESLEALEQIQLVTDTASMQDVDEGASWVLYSLTESAGIACYIGDYRRCNTYLANAARWYDATRKLEDRLQYLECRSRVFFAQSQLSLALSYANRLNNMALANGEDKYRVNALTLLGLAYCRLNNIDGAFNCKNEIDSIIGRNPKILNLVMKERILLDGEVSAYKGDLKRAYSLLFDSAKVESKSLEYDISLRSQQVYYLVQNDYKGVYQLELARKAYVDSIQTSVIFKNEQSQTKMSRDVTERLRNKISEQAEALALQSSTLVIERMLFAVVVLIVSTGVLFAVRKNSKTKTQRIEKEKLRLENEIADKIKALEQQKEMFQRTNKRISDSISYAERIQHSIMPPPEKLDEMGIEGSFIFNSPLDVVSGDFYWFAKKGSYLIVACADCTGHGIPGAFMSMIASTTLTEVVDKAQEGVSPAEILETLDEKIINNLGHNRTEYGASKDGLDVGLVSINLDTCEVEVSSARRPVILTKDQEVLTFNGTKRSIGDVDPLIRKRKFESEKFQLHRGDSLYMYSDGYSDQFGGSDGGKMKNSKVKRFIRAIHDDDIDEQSLTIQELFTQWKGDYPQTDDVLFIGIKL